ncbi:cyclic pyranopterin monophosphate synthase accessory protein [Clostridium polyendosporum]|uniref:Cyclic pyranopterin monophosphate synthase n=1 Tax=Clostridium polyendosporum TaxID=69208 RepID=A0A919S002_9CLOT|nr:cyclic pyranopterin monophosphate synthase accessory protein [Clostridium polyendosporum]
MTIEFTHFDEQGKSKMVDVSEKAETNRVAIAKGTIRMKRHTIEMVQEGTIEKGDVLGVARVAAIMASKKTADLIPMCHPLMITGCDINFKVDVEKSLITIEARVKTIGKTGVEMEALTAASVAALTIYDMCKSADKDMQIEDIYLIEKDGGKSGKYVRQAL